MKLSLVIILLALSWSCSTPDRKSEKKDIKVEAIEPFIVEIPLKTEAQWISSMGFKPEDVGFIIYDQNKKEVELSSNSDQLFTPASTLKILSAYYIQEKLGKNYQFKTQVYESNSNLYLKGDSDPLLFTSDLMQLCLGIKNKLKKFNGKFYFDETLFAPTKEIEIEQKNYESYNPGLSSLSSDFNLFNFHYRYNDQSKKLSYFLNSPFNHQFKIGDDWNFEETKQGDMWTVPKKLIYSGKESFPYKNPGYATAKKLQQLCMKVDFDLPEPQSATTPSNAKVITTHLSQPLQSIIEQGFEYSNNLIFELLLLRASQAKSIEDATQLMTQFFQKKLKNWNDVILKNASGLSHNSKISPNQMLMVLDLWSESLIPLLPISGNKGTLSNRLFEPPMLGQVWAKTGSMDYVSTLAGHLFTQKGHDLLFVIYVNNKSKTNLGKDWWALQAKKLQDELLRRWYILY